MHNVPSRSISFLFLPHLVHPNINRRCYYIFKLPALKLQLKPQSVHVLKAIGVLMNFNRGHRQFYSSSLGLWALEVVPHFSHILLRKLRNSTFIKTLSWRISVQARRPRVTSQRLRWFLDKNFFYVYDEQLTYCEAHYFSFCQREYILWLQEQRSYWCFDLLNARFAIRYFVRICASWM